MTVLLPATTRAALEMLAASRGTAVPMAGGTDLLVHWPQRLEVHAGRYVDLSGVAKLRALHWTKKELVLGGLTTYWNVLSEPQAWKEFPLLTQAARQVGAVQIQARGTWAGNIANASPAADGVPVLMAYDAVVVLESLKAKEEVPLEEFYTGYKEMRRRGDQLIVAIRVPRRAYSVQLFEKVGQRRAQAIAKVGLAVTRSAAGWRVVAASMAPTVRRCRAVEQLLEERRPIESPDGFHAAIDRDVTPIDDIRSTAAYRKRVMARLLYYDLRGVCEWIS